MERALQHQQSVELARHKGPHEPTNFQYQCLKPYVSRCLAFLQRHYAVYGQRHCLYSQRSGHLGNAPSMRRTCDLLIVGSGPAGTAAAIAARQNAPNLHTLVIDRTTFPRDKTCGDGLGPGVVARLEQLGATDLLADPRPIAALRIVGPSGESVSGPLPTMGSSEPKGFVIPRQDFDAALQTRAVAEGVEILPEHKLVTLDTSPTHAVITRAQTPHGHVSIHAKAVIAADGARSDIRRHLGIRYNSPETTGLAIRTYIKASTHPFDHMEFHFRRDLLPAYGWVFPIERGHANVGVMIDAARYHPDNKNLRTMLNEFAMEIGASEFDRANTGTYMLPYATSVPRLTHNRIALVGDAGSMINPFSGEGIAYGMAAGIEAAERAVHSLQQHTAGSPFGDFDDWFHQRFGKHFKASAYAKRLAQRGWLANFGVRAARRRPSLLAEGIHLLVGEGTSLSWRSLITVLTQGNLYLRG